MEEENNNVEDAENVKNDFAKEENPKEEMKKLPNTIWKYIVSVFSFSNDKNVNTLEVIETIEKDIEFKGPSVWILICSIIICSIGLHLNSIPVIVGAMLISPLMGPIRGIGMAVGTNNFKLLIFSLINFGVATVVSILASYLYFKIMPFKDVTTEITSRIQPLILDVLVAFFGGLAGIIAASRNNVSTVVPGVAIATALMPPLCVAGFGLATGKWNFFFGSSYLFILNSVFICLATIIVVRYLRFPLVSYINKKRERNIKIYISIFLLLILIPSGIKFMEVFNQSVFTNSAESFIKDEIEEIPNITTGRSSIDYKNKKITVFLGYNCNIPQARIEELTEKLQGEKYSLKDAKLDINQDEDSKQHNLTPDDFKLLINGYQDQILEKNKVIDKLEKENNSKSSLSYNSKEIESKLKFEKEFEKLSSFSASNSFKLNMNGTSDTTLLFVVNWNDTVINESRTNRLNDWIKLNFKCEKFDLIENTK